MLPANCPCVGMYDCTQADVLFSLLQNSTLVLTSDNRTRDAHEPSGEPESLWGRMKGKMGDRAQQGRPPELEEKRKKKEAAAQKKREKQVGVLSLMKEVSASHVVGHAGQAGTRTCLPLAWPWKVPIQFTGCLCVLV